MRIEEAIELLGVGPGAGARQTRRAYLRSLRQFPPERDPEGFKRLREAYELLREWSGWSQEELLTVTREGPPVQRAASPSGRSASGPAGAELEGEGSAPRGGSPVGSPAPERSAPGPAGAELEGEGSAPRGGSPTPERAAAPGGPRGRGALTPLEGVLEAIEAAEGSPNEATSAELERAVERLLAFDPAELPRSALASALLALMARGLVDGSVAIVARIGEWTSLRGAELAEAEGLSLDWLAARELARVAPLLPVEALQATAEGLREDDFAGAGLACHDALRDAPEVLAEVERASPLLAQLIAAGRALLEEERKRLMRPRNKGGGWAWVVVLVALAALRALDGGARDSEVSPPFPVREREYWVNRARDRARAKLREYFDVARRPCAGELFNSPPCATVSGVKERLGPRGCVGALSFLRAHKPGGRSRVRSPFPVDLDELERLLLRLCDSVSNRTRPPPPQRSSP